MKCAICDTEADKGSIITGQGFCCSEDCEQIAVSRRKATLDELEAEPVGQMPDKLETHDFERWALKFAVHFIKGLSQQDRQRISPIFLIAENLALGSACSTPQSHAQPARLSGRTCAG